MTRRWNEIHRVDSTAQALKDEAKALGAKVLEIGGAIDCVLFFRTGVYVVDFKGPKTKLTKRQNKLVADGFPIFFIRTSQELRDLLLGKTA